MKLAKCELFHDGEYNYDGMNLLLQNVQFIAPIGSIPITYRHPVDGYAPVVGKTSNVEYKNGVLFGDIEISEDSSIESEVLELVKQGFLAFSIGLYPKRIVDKNGRKTVDGPSYLEHIALTPKPRDPKARYIEVKNEQER